MQKTVQYLYLYFTKDDSDLLAWANMIKENNLGLSTWIQGILVAEAAKEKLYIGAVHIPTPQETVKRDNTQNLWGDDTESKNHKILPGWHVRGQNRSLIAGSVLPVKITRPLAQEALFELKKRHKRIAAYVKAIIRQNLEILPSGPNLAPNKTTVIDVFALCEGKIGKNNPNNQIHRDKKEQFSQRQERNHTQNTHPTQPRQGGQQGRPGKNTPPQIPTPTKPQPDQRRPQQDGQAQNRRNPLLSQID